MQSLREIKNLKGDWIYVIQVGLDGPVKIGRSSNPYRRVIHIQVDNPHILYLVGLFVGDRGVEKALHDKFSSSLLRGEWFRYDSCVADFVSKLEYSPVSLGDNSSVFEKHHSWKGTEASLSSKRSRIRKRIDKRSCDSCGKPGYDVKPKKSWDEVDPMEFMVLCRSCSMRLDGRVEAMKHRAPTPVKPPTPCVLCGKLAKPLRKGKCHSCNEKVRREARKLAIRMGSSDYTYEELEGILLKTAQEASLRKRKT